MSDNDQPEDPEAPAPARETVAFVTPQGTDASSTVAFVPTTAASPPTPPAPPPTPTPPAPPPSFRVAPPPPSPATATVAYVASEVASPLEDRAPTVDSAAVDHVGPSPAETAPASAVVQAERAADAAAAPRAITPVEMEEDAGSHRGRNILISLLIVLVVAAIVAAVVIAL